MEFMSNHNSNKHSRNISSNLSQLQTYKVSTVKDLVKSLALTKLHPQTKSMKSLPKVFYKDESKNNNIN